MCVIVVMPIMKYYMRVPNDNNKEVNKKPKLTHFAMNRIWFGATNFALHFQLLKYNYMHSSTT